MVSDMKAPDKQSKLFSTFALLSYSFLIVVLDRITKYLSDSHLDYGQPLAIFPSFDLLLAYNYGAAFSFLSDAGGWQRWVLTGISLLVSVLILRWLIQISKQERVFALALCFILGGAVGNLYDRLFYGYVVDFISLYYGSYRFATFNIADSAISVGAFLMILEVFLGKPSAEEKIDDKKG